VLLSLITLCVVLPYECSTNASSLYHTGSVNSNDVIFSPLSFVSFVCILCGGRNCILFDCLSVEASCKNCVVDGEMAKDG
jgi:hypothetical protein